MFRIVAVIFLIAACLEAQGVRDLLLPQARHVMGTVVDQDGKPVADARIEHSDDPRHEHVTDASGRFELNTDAPALVIRKTGFRGEFLRTSSRDDLRITLQKVSDARSFPSCAAKGSYVGIEGWSARFQFLRIPEITISPQGRDIDYGVRGYFVKGKLGQRGVTHGSGPMWSFGLPSDLDVWPSVKYEEVTYDLGKLTVIDARGQLSNGNRWRSLGMFGESAEYSDVDEATAGVLDKFLDSACVKP